MIMQKERLFPRFILNDRNGNAIAEAMMLLFEYMDERINEAMKVLTDVDSMPEWRLDEMAWEYNCVYDKSADIEQKRQMIKTAPIYYPIYGTAEAMKRYLETIYNTVKIEEWNEYGGQPYHFRALVTGERTDQSDAWVRNAIAQTKNIRSVLDSITFSGGGADSTIKTGTAITGIIIMDRATTQEG